MVAAGAFPTNPPAWGAAERALLVKLREEQRHRCPASYRRVGAPKVRNAAPFAPHMPVLSSYCTVVICPDDGTMSKV
jgi:hypothetical protein